MVVTITNANADLVEEPWLKEGSLVMTMGSFRETSFDVVRKADKVAVDQVGQSLHRGNVKELAEMGEIDENSFDIIIPDVLAGKGFYSPYGGKVAADNSLLRQFYVRGDKDSWLEENTQETWNNAVITKPVSVCAMHAWLKEHPGTFIAALPNQ